MPQSDNILPPTERHEGPDVRTSWPRDYRGLRSRQQRFSLLRRRRKTQPLDSETHLPAPRVVDFLGPKRKALRDQASRDRLKRALGYALGLAILSFSLWQANTLLLERGSDSGMVNTLLGIFSGILVLFLISHDGAVARKQANHEEF